MMEVMNVRLSEAISYIGKNDVLFVDLRDPEDYQEGHFRGAVNIPYDRLEKEKKRLWGYQRIFFYCDRGNLSLMACRDMKRNGYPAVGIWGGVHAFWLENSRREKDFIDSVWEKN